MDDTKPPAGATHLCELRPRDVGSGFEIVSRTRILSWRKDAAGTLLPVTAFGMVDKRAFRPHAARPEDGFCFIECRASTGERQWVSPIIDSLLFTDAQVRGMLHADVRGMLHNDVRKPEERARPTPEQQAAWVAKVHARHVAIDGVPPQRRSSTQRHTSTQRLRRELEALKKRYAGDAA